MCASSCFSPAPPLKGEINLSPNQLLTNHSPCQVTKFCWCHPLFIYFIVGVQGVSWISGHLESFWHFLPIDCSLSHVPSCLCDTNPHKRLKRRTSTEIGIWKAGVDPFLSFKALKRDFYRRKWRRKETGEGRKKKWLKGSLLPGLSCCCQICKTFPFLNCFQLQSSGKMQILHSSYLLSRD